MNPDNETHSGEFQFNVGVIGATGYIGAPYRAEIRQAAGANIVALCARRRELLERAGEEDGAELLTGNWRRWYSTRTSTSSSSPRRTRCITRP